MSGAFLLKNLEAKTAQGILFVVFLYNKGAICPGKPHIKCNTHIQPVLHDHRTGYRGCECCGEAAVIFTMHRSRLSEMKAW